MTTDVRNAPLHGIKVLDFGHIVAAPFLALLLAVGAALPARAADWTVEESLYFPC